MKLTEYHLQKVRGELLAVLKPFSFYIAGGAVRDMLLGRDVKDIDVLIKGVPREERDFEDFAYERSVARKVAEHFGSQGVETTSESGYEDDGSTYATYEVGTGDLNLPRLNLIFTYDLYDALNAFPDELSQAFIDEVGHVTTSDGFERIRAHLQQHGGRVTVLTRLYPDNKRLARLSEKYPEVAWACPDPSEPAKLLSRSLEQLRIEAELEWV